MNPPLFLVKVLRVTNPYMHEYRCFADSNVTEVMNDGMSCAYKARFEYLPGIEGAWTYPSWKSARAAIRVCGARGVWYEIVEYRSK